MASQQAAGSGFFEWSGPSRTGVDVGGAEIELPIRYYRTDVFLGIFRADLDAARAILPSSRLHPVRVTAKSAAVGIVAFNYIETGVGPYGEIGVVVLCTLDRPAPAVLPLLAESRWPGFGAFVAHLPVTTRIALQAGRTIWGYPKFVADMAFDLSPERQSVELREGGRDVLSLTVRRGGIAMRDRRPLVTFTAHGDDLVRTVIPTRASYLLGTGARAGSLTLGDHPVADDLRALGVSRSPIITRSFQSHSAILPEGEIVGPLDRPYDGYRGAARAAGTHTVRYDRGSETVVTVGDPTDAAVAKA